MLMGKRGIIEHEIRLRLRLENDLDGMKGVLCVLNRGGKKKKRRGKGHEKKERTRERGRGEEGGCIT